MFSRNCLVFCLGFLLLCSPIAQAAEDKAAQFEQLSTKIESLNDTIVELSLQAQTLKKELADINLAEQNLRQRMITDADAFDTAMRRLIQLHRQPEQALLAADLIDRQSHRTHVVEQSQKSLSNAIKERRSKLQKLLEATAEQETKIAALTQTQIKLATKREKLMEYQRKILVSMEATPAERKALKKQAEQLKNATNLSELLQNAQIKPIRLLTSAAAENIPVDGQIIHTFNEKTETGVTAMGITIATSPGTPVFPWQNGRVIYSDTFRDYGHLVIVEHADGVHALYSGLVNNNAAKVGDVAEVGKALGFTPQTEKPLVYLEARKNGDSIDPMRFLKTTK